MREIYNEQRFECGKNKDTNRKGKKMNDKDEIIHVLQPVRSPRILTRKNKKRDNVLNINKLCLSFKSIQKRHRCWL